MASNPPHVRSAIAAKILPTAAGELEESDSNIDIISTDHQSDERETVEGTAPSATAAEPSSTQLSETPTTRRLPSPPDGYLSSKEVDVVASPAQEVTLIFPEGVALGKNKASAILTLYIEPNGIVSEIEISNSDLPIAFEKSAIETFKHVRMHPALKNSIPVKSRKKILVEYEEEQRGLLGVKKKSPN